MDDIYKNIEDYNPNKWLKILIVFDDMIADMLSNKKLNPTKLVIRGRKLNTYLVFIMQFYFWSYVSITQCYSYPPPKKN